MKHTPISRVCVFYTHVWRAGEPICDPCAEGIRAGNKQRQDEYVKQLAEAEKQAATRKENLYSRVY